MTAKEIKALTDFGGRHERDVEFVEPFIYTVDTGPHPLTDREEKLLPEYLLNKEADPDVERVTYGEKEYPGNTEEVDPNGKDAHEAGSKLDAGKPDCSLLGFFGKALLEVSKVGTIGAKKYSRGGWQHVDSGFDRYTAAMLRHNLAEGYDERDEDTGMYHCAQVAWNALARLELFLREKDNE